MKKSDKERLKNCFYMEQFKRADGTAKYNCRIIIGG